MGDSQLRETASARLAIDGLPAPIPVTRVLIPGAYTTDAELVKGLETCLVPVRT